MGTSYRLASETAEIIQSRSTKVIPCRLASRPDGKITPSRPSAIAAFAYSKVLRDLAALRLSFRHSTGAIWVPSCGKTRKTSLFAKKYRSGRFADQGINDAFYRHCNRTFSQSTKYGSMQRISASRMLKSKIRKNRRRTIVISCVARESIYGLCNTAMTGFDVGAGLNRQRISAQNFDAVDLPTVGGIDHRIA